jgi:hypothetical protein
LYYSVRSIDHVRQLDDQRHRGSLSKTTPILTSSFILDILNSMYMLHTILPVENTS